MTYVTYGCVSVSVVELAWGGCTTNGTTMSILMSILFAPSSVAELNGFHVSNPIDTAAPHQAALYNTATHCTALVEIFIYNGKKF